MQLIKSINQVIYFLVELSMLASLGYTGFQLSQHPFGKYVTGIGLPLLAAILWGVFAAPRSAHRLELPYRSLFALTLFGLTVFLLYRTGQTRLAIYFGSIALICESIALALKQ